MTEDTIAQPDAWSEAMNHPDPAWREAYQRGYDQGWNEGHDDAETER